VALVVGPPRPVTLLGCPRPLLGCPRPLLLFRGCPRCFRFRLVVLVVGLDGADDTNG
jgi:hypothetical protein